MTLRRWDIWLANVPYDGQPVSKPRPVLVLDDDNLDVFVFKMTKTPPRSNFENEYPVIDWRGAGLRVQTTIRGGRRLRISKDAFIHKIGTLKAIDILNVKEFI